MYSYLITKPCLTLCDPPDRSPARLLCPRDSPGKHTGAACSSFSRGSSRPRHRTRISCESITRGFFTTKPHAGSLGIIKMHYLTVLESQQVWSFVFLFFFFFGFPQGNIYIFYLEDLAQNKNMKTFTLKARCHCLIICNNYDGMYEPFHEFSIKSEDLVLFFFN